MQAKLIPLDGGRSVRLKKDVTLVGRKRGVCDIYLDRSSVSKLHCLIVKTDGLLFIRDLGSTNGTKVNGQRVTRGALLPGDELSFANAKFRVQMGPTESAPHDAEATELMTSSPDAPRQPDNDSEDDLDEEEFGIEEEVGVGSESDVQLLSDDSVY